MRQDFVHDEVIAELGGTSFMTKQGHVVEGNYRTGDSVLLVFDHSCKRWLPRYKKEQQRSAEKKPVAAVAPLEKRKPCTCELTIVGPSEVKNGEDTSHTVSINYDKVCRPSQYIGIVPTWEIVPEGKCSGTEIAPPSEWELLWTSTITPGYPSTGEDFCYVTLVASFEGVGGRPACHAEKRVKILGCTCEVSIDLAPGSKVGSGTTVTATKDLSLLGCSSDREEDHLTVSWDVSVQTCVGTCSVEMISEDANHIVFIPTVEGGDEGYAVFNVHVEVVGPDNVPFCEKDELLYVGCWCDVLAIAPSPVVTGKTYQATVKGWYHSCTPTEKQMAPLTYWFHDCVGSGPMCDVQILNIQEISEDPPEYRFNFTVHPLSGSGSVVLSVQMGSGEDDVPYCRYDLSIHFDCCLKDIGDRYVLMYFGGGLAPDSPVNPITLPAGDVSLTVNPEQDGGCPPFTWTHSGWGTLVVSTDTLSATLKRPTEEPGCKEKVTVTVRDVCGTEDMLEIGSCCDFDELEIVYTSLVMECSSSQGLGVANGCGPPYEWSLASGGGTLTPIAGENGLYEEATYESPASNEGCTLNPIITVKDCCGGNASLKLAINCNPSGVAYWQTTYDDVGQATFCSAARVCRHMVTGYNCDGTVNFMIGEINSRYLQPVGACTTIKAGFCGFVGCMYRSAGNACFACNPANSEPCTNPLQWWAGVPCSVWEVFGCGSATKFYGDCASGNNIDSYGNACDKRTDVMKAAGCCPINPLTGLPF